MVDTFGLMLAVKRIAKIKTANKKDAGGKNFRVKETEKCSVTTVKNKKQQSTVIQTKDGVTVAFEWTNHQMDSE